MKLTDILLTILITIITLYITIKYFHIGCCSLPLELFDDGLCGADNKPINNCAPCQQYCQQCSDSPPPT